MDVAAAVATNDDEQDDNSMIKILASVLETLIEVNSRVSSFSSPRHRRN